MAPGDDERRLGEVVLFRDLLKERVVGPRLEDHDRSGIAAKSAAREGVDLKDGKLHALAGPQEWGALLLRRLLEQGAQVQRGDDHR